jgi:hypothetical protein
MLIDVIFIYDTRLIRVSELPNNLAIDQLERTEVYDCFLG